MDQRPRGRGGDPPSEPADEPGPVGAEELARLPRPYRVALDGIARGLPDEELAELVGVDPAAVPALVRLATAKLLEGRAARRPGGAAGEDA